MRCSSLVLLTIQYRQVEVSYDDLIKAKLTMKKLEQFNFTFIYVCTIIIIQLEMLAIKKLKQT